MTDMVCYNCGVQGHKSVNCPEPPKKSRCPSCDKVDGHTSSCQNPVFVSKSRYENTTVFEMKNTLKIEFQKVRDEFFVLDVNRKIMIGNAPLWLSGIDTFVGKVGVRALDFAMSRPMKRHITIMSRGEPVLSLVFFEKMLKLNNRFEMNDKGTISFNTDGTNAITEQVVSKIGIYTTEEVFKARISWHGHKHVFDVYPTIGPVLLDPQRPERVPQQPSHDGATTMIRVNVFDRAGPSEDKDTDDQAGAVGNDPGAEIQPNLLFERTFKLSLNLNDLNRPDFDMEREFGDLVRSAIRGMKRDDRQISERKKE